LVVVGWLRPQIIRLVYVSWMIAVFPIGWTVSRGRFWGSCFTVCLRPLGLASSDNVGRDALGLSLQPEADSYWAKKGACTDKHRYLQTVLVAREQILLSIQLVVFKGKKMSPNDFQKLASKKSNPILLVELLAIFLRPNEENGGFSPVVVYLADCWGLANFGCRARRAAAVLFILCFSYVAGPALPGR